MTLRRKSCGTVHTFQLSTCLCHTLILDFFGWIFTLLLNGLFRYVGRLFVKASGRPQDILPKLRMLAGFSQDDDIELFEVSLLKKKPTLPMFMQYTRCSASGCYFYSWWYDIYEVCLQHFIILIYFFPFINFRKLSLIPMWCVNTLITGFRFDLAR
jgi:hypothetical protein